MLNMAAGQEKAAARENSEILIVGVDKNDDCIVVDSVKGKGPAKGKHYKRKNSFKCSPIVISPDLTVVIENSTSHEGRGGPSTTVSIEDRLDVPVQKKKKSSNSSCEVMASQSKVPGHPPNSSGQSTSTSTAVVSVSTDNHINSDYEFALQLYKELNKEPSPYQYQAADEALARKLQEEEYATQALRQSSKGGPDVQVVKTTKVVAKPQASSQSETDYTGDDKKDLPATTSTKGVPVPQGQGNDARLSDQSLTPSVTASCVRQPPSVTASCVRQPPSVTASCVRQPPSVTASCVRQPLTAVETTGSSVPASVDSVRHNSPARNSGVHDLPLTWTRCPNCPTGITRRYHLIDLASGSEEWLYVSNPLTARNFVVTRVQRIQNAALWQRFQSEKQLMMQARPTGFDVNERLVYHTSKADKTVICEEGLDQRLSRAGNFGAGIYFSDDPQKCNAYWIGSHDRIMFACRVLLGDIKVYPSGQSDMGLRREPLKTSPRPEESKAYDSVRGNVSGHNEFVVYNTYRVIPEYVLEYTQIGISGSSGSRRAARKHTSNATLLAHAQMMVQQAAIRRGHHHRISAHGLPNFTLPPPTVAPVPPQTATGSAPMPPQVTVRPSAPPPVPATGYATGSVTAAPLPVPPGNCQLCWNDPATCECGLNSKRQCKYCRNPPTKCTCPTYKSASGGKIPYRCLTPLNQGLVKRNRAGAAACSGSCSRSGNR